ncbi:pyridoxamine 5'-phosphate oxidase family protein [Corynebacterium comes]|uniref:Pyridoxamine 5'-phosphate oxidase n=1 Tax=Corynebacterium comes TaxID=2675218 RepID=A0A6B8W125_9CORY|nr:pyridoxamine 5'-phosphate oxidase family protein [Corynebacterium comes]QGU05065.1 Pyridoxamine 5'-phosphate oxidase [Corynebacterium comes]
MADEITKEDVVTKLRDASWVMMTTTDTDGRLLSHPMVPQQVTDDADVWFFISLRGGHAEALKASPQVNLAVSEAGTWLSVAAEVEFVEDRAKVDELWNRDVEGWFEGKDDPALGLIRADSESAQYWGLPGGKMSALARILKSRVAGDRTGGDSGTMEL